jgi:hypothetical protein
MLLFSGAQEIYQRREGVNSLTFFKGKKKLPMPTPALNAKKMSNYHRSKVHGVVI